VADPNDGFGAEDKLVACDSGAGPGLIFIDLDNNMGVQLRYSVADGSSTSVAIPAVQCNAGAQPPLYPRDSGYVVTTTKSPATQRDRMIILGGDPSDANIWYSDDCGVTWVCSTQPQAWNPRIYTATVDATGVLPGDPLVFAGGLTDLQSIAQFHSADGGITWSRPACADGGNCQKDCQSTGSSECTLPVADPVGTCSASNPNFNLCYLLPDVPCYPGSIGRDWNALYFFLEPDEDGMIWKLDASTVSTGWSLAPGTYGGLGRKSFIKGTTVGSGCWFSTDFSVEDLWVGDDPGLRPISSSNNFATASSAAGPWLSFVGNATWPWPARASAAVVSGAGMNTVIVGSGMTFSNGVPQQPVFSDAYSVDVGVCLLATVNNQVCANNGQPDFVGVGCACNGAPNTYLPSSNCGTCNVGNFGWPACGACPAGSSGACNNNGAGAPSGSCDPVRGCVCAAGWLNGGGTGSCDTCAPGNFGPSCLPCTCDPIGNGGGTQCDGSGSAPPRSGSGICTSCKDGFIGDNCDQCDANRYGQQCLTCSAPCVAPGGACSQGRGGDGSCQCTTGYTNAPAGCTDCDISYYGPTCTACSLCNAPGGLCDGGGTHGGSGSCVCQPGWTNSANGCSDCDANSWGTSCSACAACDATGGTCDGSGTHSGSGACLCQPGFTGGTCSACDASHYGSSCAACAACSPAGGSCDGGGDRSRGSGQCICNDGYAGADCSTCDATHYGAVCDACLPCSPDGGSCNGGGTTGGDGTCTCNQGWAGSNCAGCDVGYYGGQCALCLPCDPLGGVCDGTGTTRGSGMCVCNPGFVGADCSSPAPAAAAAGLDSGTAAGVGVGVSAALVAVGLWVFVARFGGGPALSAAAAYVRKAVARAAAPAAGDAAAAPGGGSGAGERTSILRAAAATAARPPAAVGAAAPTLSSSAAAARFGALAGTARPANAVYSNL